MLLGRCLTFLGRTSVAAERRYYIAIAMLALLALFILLLETARSCPMSWEHLMLVLLLAGACTVLVVHQWLPAFAGLIAVYLGSSLLLIAYTGTVVGITRIIIGLQSP